MTTPVRMRMRALFFGTALLAAVSVPLRPGMGDEPSIRDLRDEVRALEERAAELKTQNEGIRRMLADLEDDDLYIAVDTQVNRLYLRQGKRVLRTVVVGTGSRQEIREETGRSWYFESPQGTLTVIGKERNPVWIRPDWSYVEENMPIPAPDDPDRFVRDVMGKYALLLGNGYKIHGTTFKNLLGTQFTHGCVSMDDPDLEAVYRAARIGTRVYIF